MNWPEDIRHMHEWFGTSNCVTEMDKDTREQFMELRLRMITEEVDETTRATEQYPSPLSGLRRQRNGISLETLIIKLI